jgi:hypothetical protein
MIQGQILSESERCKLISKILQNYNCKKVVEIGTWKGLGSTLCILNSMSQDSEFITLESNKTFYDIAKQNLISYQEKLKMIYGRIVSIEEVNQFVSTLSLDHERQIWLKDDISNLNSSPNVIDEIFNEIDFLLLDGGEFSTYNEWTKLKDRTKIVALDDINEIKTNKIFNELSQDDKYELLDITKEGNGFCVFIKKNGTNSIK